MSPRFKILLLLTLLFCFHTGKAQSRFWRISGPQLSQSSFLYGTMHLADKRIFNFPPGTMDSLRSCKSLVLEINPGNTGSNALAMVLTMHSDTMLNKLIPDSDFQFVKNYFAKSMGLNEQVVNSMKPIILSTLITEKSKDASEAYPLDLWFYHQALKDSMKIEGLETVKYQMSLLDSIPLREQAQDLIKALRNPEKSDSLSEVFMRYYVKGELDSLVNISLRGNTSSDFGQLFIYSRNHKMASKIGELIGKERCFIAIGAAHLTGKQGVIGLLRKAGYTVEPLKE